MRKIKIGSCIYTRHRSILLPSHVSKKMASNENLDVEALKSRIDEQGNLVRKIKSDPNRKVCHKNNLNNFFFF